MAKIKFRERYDPSLLPLKKIVAQQALDIDALKMVLSRKWQARRPSKKCAATVNIP